jgi:hypothetical protein
MNDIHDPDLQRRFLATKEFQFDGNKLDEKWPRACWGSANAWIILVGPSPGAPKDANNSCPREPDRPDDSCASISLQAGHIDFPNRKNRNVLWRSLIDQFTGCNKEYTEALTGICNLDWVEQANQSLVQEKYLRQGCLVVDRIIRKTKPRVVAAMTVRVWDLLSEYYRQNIEAEVPSCGLKRNPLRLRIFQEFETFLIKTRHPSWPISSVEKDAYRRFAKDHLLTNQCQAGAVDDGKASS